MHFTPFPIIQTNRLMLRQLNESDAEAILSIHSNEDVGKYLLRPLKKKIGEARDFITKINSSIETNNAIMWGIALKDDDKLIGTICFWDIRHQNYRSQIGFELHPDYQRKGIMQEAIDVVINYGFEQMKLHSIEAYVNPVNLPSVAILEKNKFTKEAHLKECVFHNGEFIDEAIYSLLKSAN